MRMDMNDFLNKVSGEVVDVITEFIEDNFDTEDFSEQDMGELTEAINEYFTDLASEYCQIVGTLFFHVPIFLCMENCGDIMEFVDHTSTT